MIRNLFLASLLVLGFGACSDAQTAAPARGEANAAPHLALNEDYVEYKGKRLTFKQDLAAWEKVLGPTHRNALSEASDIVVWDDLGIRVYTNYPKDLTVRTVAVTLKGLPEDSLAYIAPGEGVRPRADYKGAVSVSAVKVDKNTRVGDIARLSNDRLRIDCSRGIDLCTASRKDDRFKDVSTYFGVDDRRYDSIPYEIEFGPGRDGTR
ncbi:TPA: hypothetical protein QDZ99_002982 [Stenotrophomonas maltophilia]|uniref:DUF7738 domain-containing protein n=1 Tax=Stenotrophomonas TaxID=40323 RepID=UPI0015DD8981|nr:hypothetical protein [Stenotrophomonas maltophilia]MBA0448747.1 hypothetical protein [Stenotrophomonas maltophilia]HDS1131044.1 hypothetical protein [Stenotrophomonas maltophilia]HDS1157225.1 hypothetical protein [Stenotrophomonas maltophilia]HDS1167656.1 hypothetical protein [Stenotrophomonas maltophilia]HDS1171256.1 hypothetical protein [Stenotrophomonas maltophilia]